MAAGVATVAIVALQQRAISPACRRLRAHGAKCRATRRPLSITLSARSAPMRADRARRSPIRCRRRSAEVPSRHRAGAPDQLCVRAQPVFLRSGPARRAGGLADRGDESELQPTPLQRAAPPAPGRARRSMTRAAAEPRPLADSLRLGRRAAGSALPQRARGADDPREWLEKMNQGAGDPQLRRHVFSHQRAAGSRPCASSTGCARDG